MDIQNRLKKALFEKGWTQRKLCQELGMTENGLKYTIDNNSWKLDTIEKMASLLGLPVSYFVSDVEENLDDKPRERKALNFGDEVITKMSNDIRELKSFFEEELREKNQQIAVLHRMLESVLGKSEGDSNQPTSTLEKAQAKAELAYKGLGAAMMLPYIFPDKQQRVSLITE